MCARERSRATVGTSLLVTDYCLSISAGAVRFTMVYIMDVVVHIVAIAM